MNKNNQENLFENIKNTFSNYYFIADDYSEKFSQLLWENPEKALDELFNIYDEALNKSYTDSKTGENHRFFVEATCGGPHEAIPSALYNSIGLIYPILDRETKNYALKKILGILDGIKSDYVQISHTSYIHEPLLLSDITIARPIYWPGLDEGKFLINKSKIFPDFKVEFIDENGFFKKDKVNSDFLVGYSLLRSDFCNWGEDYVNIVNQNFLNRVLKGIVSMRFSHFFSLKNLSEEEIEGINKEAGDSNFYSNIKDKFNESLNLEISNGEKRLKELLPSSLHSKVKGLILERDWVNFKDFITYKNYILERTIDSFVK
ncbi:MAG: hypothetical protein WC812_03760 [Candidatus Pacearchaeota archaeon]|jgi:hypothetical protein